MNVFKSKRIIYLFVMIFITTLIVPLTSILAKYITTLETKEVIHASLFYTSGDYIQKINAEANTPRIDVSGWKDGIYLKLYNYEGEDVSEINLKYECVVSNGWQLASNLSNEIVGGTKGEVELKLIPPSDAKKGDEIHFELKTSPYAISLEAIFILSDSNVCDYTIEDMNEYVLVTIYTNDYIGNVTLNYDNRFFVPDSTNPLMENWDLSLGTGSIAVERFTTYELIFFEEVDCDVSTVNGIGNTITLADK